MSHTLKMSRQAQQRLTFNKQEQGLYEITRDIVSWIESQPTTTGLLAVFYRHPSASLTIQENVDPAVLEDLQHFFKQLAPEDGSSCSHTIEGPDNRPAHKKDALTATCLSISVSCGLPALGVWQGIFLLEYRLQPHNRQIILYLTGA